MPKHVDVKYQDKENHIITLNSRDGRITNTCQNQHSYQFLERRRPHPIPEYLSVFNSRVESCTRAPQAPQKGIPRC